MTQAIIGAGSKLSVEIDSTMTEIAEITNVGEIGQTAPEQDATPINATAREYTGGLRDGNNVGITGSWVAGNAEHKFLRDSLGTTKTFKIEWADGDGAEFDLAITSAMRGETTAEGLLQFMLEGRISGEIIWTDAPNGE